MIHNNNSAQCLNYKKKKYKVNQGFEQTLNIKNQKLVWLEEAIGHENYRKFHCILVPGNICMYKTLFRQHDTKQNLQIKVV